jgi:hypothetical protein
VRQGGHGCLVDAMEETPPEGSESCRIRQHPRACFGSENMIHTRSGLNVELDIPGGGVIVSMNY